tara:strand:- start:628 stop:774 length:147 start_codon:yes stop_codon:yes gene_type:complete
MLNRNINSILAFPLNENSYCIVWGEYQCSEVKNLYTISIPSFFIYKDE